MKQLKLSLLLLALLPLHYRGKPVGKPTTMIVVTPLGWPTMGEPQLIGTTEDLVVSSLDLSG